MSIVSFGFGIVFGLAVGIAIAVPATAFFFKRMVRFSIRQDEKNPRRLTPRECARLQGFPESYKITVSNTRAYKQFGNSVVVPLVTAIAGCIVKKMKQLDNKKTEGC